MRHPADKVITLEAAVDWRRNLRRDGATLAVTNGCFDLLHRTHVEFLWRARRLADGLLVLLNSDTSVWQLKGDGRPIVPQNERAFLLAALPCVSAVVIFDGPRCAEELEALAPDIYAKSADYTLAQDASEAEALRRVGTQTIFLPVEPGLTTTALIERAFAAEQARRNRPARPHGHPDVTGGTDLRGSPDTPSRSARGTLPSGAAGVPPAAPRKEGPMAPSGGRGGRAASAPRSATTEAA